ncbi:MAG: TetR/AcrR family transcriptional regulator [Anaerolineae bacterium]|nr:TetR/AcrR family transcriptional regulator [Anaerolineae bacterium]
MDNRSKILSCALQLFAARGYDAVGVQEIAEAAGITKPTLYHYFGSKYGLLQSLLQEQFTELQNVLLKVTVYHGDLPLTLTRVTQALFDYAATHRRFYRMQLSMWFAPPDSESLKAISEVNGDQQQILEQLFIQAAQDHGNMRGRHRAYATTFLGMINTYIGLALNNHLALDDELVYKAVHQFMYGIFS